MVKTLLPLAVAAVAGFALVGCANSGSAANAGSGGTSGGTTGGDGKASGAISLDGSSTVYPISAAAAEDFNDANPQAKASAASSGTGGGFKKFAAGELDIAGASRPIEEKEIEACKANKIDFVEIPIAFDGIAVCVNPKNSFLSDVTPDELKKLWQGGSKVKNWSDLRAGFPATPVKLYGPGSNNGTFDYFTEAICGKKGDERTDYQSAPSPNTLVQGVAGDEAALGYFGYAYYEQNKANLKLVKVAGVEPNKSTILDGTYAPLSRPLFWYVKLSSLDRPEVMQFVKNFLTNGKSAIEEAGYVPLPDEAYQAGLKLLEGKKTGTRFKTGETGVKFSDILQRMK